MGRERRKRGAFVKTASAGRRGGSGGAFSLSQQNRSAVTATRFSFLPLDSFICLSLRLLFYIYIYIYIHFFISNDYNHHHGCLFRMRPSLFGVASLPFSPGAGKCPDAGAI